MAFPLESYEQARAELRKRKARAEIEATARHEEYKKTHPEYARVSAELGQTGAELVLRIFSHGPDGADIADIRERNLELQKRAVELLALDGLEYDAFEPKYSCAKCGDTGVTDSGICECVKDTMKKAAYDRLNRATPLALCSFDKFSLSVYPDEPLVNGVSPRRHMERVAARCREYAESFDRSSPSLLLQGGVGLGKTHLSLAIAGRVIERGFNVIYGTAQELISRVEAEKFGRERSDTDTLSLLKECDLLILDDLGVEFRTGFTVSVLYELLNDRLLTASPTIISTNLSLEGLSERYEDRLLSRITGEYTRLPFTGKDVRIELRKQNGGKQ